MGIEWKRARPERSADARKTRSAEPLANLVERIAAAGAGVQHQRDREKCRPLGCCSIGAHKYIAQNETSFRIERVAELRKERAAFVDTQRVQNIRNENRIEATRKVLPHKIQSDHSNPLGKSGFGDDPTRQRNSPGMLNERHLPPRITPAKGKRK